MRKATGLTKCPVGGCENKPAPDFCKEHRAKVSPFLLMRIGRRLWALRSSKKTGDVPKDLLEMLVEGVREATRKPANEVKL